MTSRTKAALVKRVCTNMNLLRPGQEPSQTVARTILDYWDDVHATLVSEQIAYFPADEIPAQVFIPAAWLLTLEVAPAFGTLPIVLQALGFQDGEAAKDTQRRRMRDHIAKDFDEERTEVIPY